MRTSICGWIHGPSLLVARSGSSAGLRSICYQRPLCSTNMKMPPINMKSLSPRAREKLRLMSKAIPLVADKDPVDVIFEDEDFLVLNKPDFVKMHPSHRFEGGSLLNRAIGYCGYPPYILHRLDMHTTGVVVFAKKREMCKPISEQFASGKVRKEYLLIADGCPSDGAGSEFYIDAPVQRHASVKFARVLGSDGEDSKPARTLFKVMGISSSMKMSLMHIFPETGRTHQIRLHAAHAGFPIVGDCLYNPRERDLYESIEILSESARDASKVRYADNNPLRAGLKLHAWKISLENPITKLAMTFCAPPWSHFDGLMKQAKLKIPPNLV